MTSLHDDAVLVLKTWVAPDETQEKTRLAFLEHLADHPDGMFRECAAGHLTASALVLNPERTHVLLTLHKKIKCWLQLGGHCERSDTTLAAAALREATEESGIDALRIEPRLAALHVHPVTCSLGVPTRHLDLQFVAHAPPGAQIAISDESDDLRWWPADALPEGTDHALAYLVAQATRP